MTTDENEINNNSGFIEPIEAKIFIPITASYTEKDFLVRMPPEELKRINTLGVKIVGEERPITLKSTDRDEIRRQVIELCEKYHPRPLFVKLNTTLNRTFLIDKRYYKDDPNGIFEHINFSYTDKANQIQEFIRHESEEWNELMRSAYAPYEAQIKAIQEQIGSIVRRGGGDVTPLQDKLGKLRPSDADIAKLREHHNKSIISELATRFGIKYPIENLTQSSPRKYLGVYTTTSEIPTREQYHFGLHEITFDYIEEKCRFIHKGPLNSLRSFTEYFFKVHNVEFTALQGASNVKHRPSRENLGMAFRYGDRGWAGFVEGSHNRRIRDTTLKLEARGSKMDDKFAVSWFCRISRGNMRLLGVRKGDVIEIRGVQRGEGKEQARAVAKCLPLTPDEDDEDFIFIDDMVMKNAHVAIGDMVSVKSVDNPPAAIEVILFSMNELFGLPAEVLHRYDYFAKKLAGAPLATGNVIGVPYANELLTFRVVWMAPEEIAVVDEKDMDFTEFEIWGGNVEKDAEPWGTLKRALVRYTSMIEVLLNEHYEKNRVGMATENWIKFLNIKPSGQFVERMDLENSLAIVKRLLQKLFEVRAMVEPVSLENQALGIRMLVQELCDPHTEDKKVIQSALNCHALQLDTFREELEEKGLEEDTELLKDKDLEHVRKSLDTELEWAKKIHDAFQ